MFSGSSPWLASGRKSSSDDDSMIPLINIVFLMLVFFMVAGKVASQDGIDFDAPDSHSEKLIEDESHVIALTANRQLRIDGELVESVTGSDLLSRFSSELNLDGDPGSIQNERVQPHVLLKVDAGLPASVLDPLLLALKEANIQQVTLVVEASAEG